MRGLFLISARKVRENDTASALSQAEYGRHGFGMELGPFGASHSAMLVSGKGADI